MQWSSIVQTCYTFTRLKKNQIPLDEMVVNLRVMRKILNGDLLLEMTKETKNDNVEILVLQEAAGNVIGPIFPSILMRRTCMIARDYISEWSDIKTLKWIRCGFLETKRIVVSVNDHFQKVNTRIRVPRDYFYEWMFTIFDIWLLLLSDFFLFLLVWI